MDPRIQALIRAQASQRAGVQEQPQPEQEIPEEGGEFSLGNGEFDQNPFAALLAQAQGGGQPQPQPGAEQGGFQQVPQGMEEAAAMGGVMAPEDDQLQKGGGAGASKFLLGAAQQLQGYISESTERDEIAIARSILQLLTKLIDRDQEAMTARLESQQAPQAGGQPDMGGMMAQMMGGAQGGMPGAAQGQ